MIVLGLRSVDLANQLVQEALQRLFVRYIQQ
jgi:hypothetical protein